MALHQLPPGVRLTPPNSLLQYVQPLLSLQDLRRGIIMLFSCHSHPFNCKSLRVRGSSASWTCLVCSKVLSEYLVNELETAVLNFLTSFYFLSPYCTDHKPPYLFSTSQGVHPVILSPSTPCVHFPQVDNLQDISDPHPPHSHLYTPLQPALFSQPTVKDKYKKFLLLKVVHDDSFQCVCLIIIDCFFLTAWFQILT